MTISVNIAEAKAQLSHLIAQAKAGEEVIICNRNAPEVRMVAVEQKPKKKREFGFAKGKITLLPGWDDPIYTDEELDEIYNAPLFPQEDAKKS